MAGDDGGGVVIALGKLANVEIIENLFVSPAKMPGWLQAFVRVNPMTDLTSAARGLMVGGPVAGPALKSLVWAVGIVVVFAPSRSRSTAARPEPHRPLPHRPQPHRAAARMPGASRLLWPTVRCFPRRSRRRRNLESGH
jgi:hypothetical protein